MSLYSKISRNLILPLGDFVMGYSISRNLRFLEKSQWWSMKELHDYQNKKLRALINHAYENVPYYHQVFRERKLYPEDIRTTNDLKKLPILTKELIKENFPDNIVAKSIPVKQRMVTASSGSTGEPLQYYITKKAWGFAIACTLRGWYWMGYQLGDKYVKLSQNPRDSQNKKIQDRIFRCKYLFSQQLTNENFKNIIDEIQKYQPLIIRGYPDPMMFLARYAKDHGIKAFNDLIAITTTGNILFNGARDLIENQFSCKIFDAYSCEGGATAFECPTHDCYHSSMEYAISEIISDGEEVGGGERGQLISTDLMNYSVPFIRYDSQDVLIKGDHQCSCGRSLLTIKKIVGRNNDILVTPSGKYLIVHNFTGYFEWIESVDKFQIIQDEMSHININLVVNDKFNKKIEEEIILYWQNYIGKDVQIDINIVDDIPLLPSGKRRFLIRKFQYTF